MGKMLIKQYMDKMERMNNKEYLFAVIAYNIAPTIAKYKPSSIITLNKNYRNLNVLWEIYKEDFKQQYDIEFCEMRKEKNSVTILFYHKDELFNTVFLNENMRFLNRFGYHKGMKLEECVQLLKERFKNVCPHEMGIFLGIPLEDVITFIKYPYKKCLYCKYWKVYTNLEKAKQKFNNYDKAKNIVIQAILKDKPISIKIS